MRQEKQSRVLFFSAIASLFMLLGVGITSVCANASDSNTSMQIMNPPTGTPIVTKTYKEGNTSETNVSKYNTKDWERSFSNQGFTSTSLIGNTNALFGGSAEGKIANSGDLEQLKNASLAKNKTLSGNKSINAFDAVLMNTVMTDSTNNAFGQIASVSKNIKCYITRNVGSTYMCNAPTNSLTMSSGMSGRDSLAKLKEQCESQCYVQNACVNMEPNEQNITETPAPIIFTLKKSSPSRTFVLPIRSDLTTTTFDFTEAQKTANINYTISYVDLSGKERLLVSNLLSPSSTFGDKELYIGDIASSLKITVSLVSPYADSISADISLGNISIKYQTNSKYVCPSVQDISNKDAGKFGNNCANGKANTLSRTVGATTQTYKICTKQTYPGQNADGSFYQKAGCESVCRKQYDCTLLPGGSVSYESLKGFQEGCIENSSLDCSNFNNDCAAARLNLNAKVVNELVFGANSRPISTVIGGVTTGLERPRLSLSKLSPALGALGGTYAPNDAEFEEEKKEEWKDGAYSSMMTNATWNVSDVQVGDNTPANHAYGINLKSGSFYGFAGTSTRALVWRLKPASYDVDSGINFKLYSVLRTIVQNTRYDQSGTGEKKDFFDEIWYVKTGAGDSFKPFYYNYDAYNIQTVKGDYDIPMISYVPKSVASPQYSTFSAGTWGAISSADSAENFRGDDFSATNVFWEYELIGDIDNDFDVLPGLIHSVVRNNEKDTVNYAGARDLGTSGNIVKLFVSIGYSQSSLTYNNLVDMVKNGTLTTIYETGNENKYPRSFKGDGNKDNEVKLYLYGQKTKGSAYLDIKPQPAQVGKKGFIFVFGE